MYARWMAVSCLLLATSMVGRSESAHRAAISLAVHLKPNETISRAALSEMKSELEALMAAAGFHIEWLDSDQSGATTADSLIFVDLRGTCATFSEATALPLPSSDPLASSSVADGHILPFTWVDCSALNHFLGSGPSNMFRARRDSIFGRAMARLLAHEFYHVLAQTSDHTAAGIGKASLSVADLQAAHFAFDSIAAARLHSHLAGSSLYVNP